MTLLRATALGFALSLVPPAVMAQQDAPSSPAEDGTGLIQQGIQSILEGLITGMQPAIEDMGRALDEMRPMAEHLLKLIDDIGNYEAPVVLENGDILIRRKPQPPRPLQDGEIEL